MRKHTRVETPSIDNSVLGMEKVPASKQAKVFVAN